MTQEEFEILLVNRLGNQTPHLLDLSKVPQYLLREIVHISLTREFTRDMFGDVSIDFEANEDGEIWSVRFNRENNWTQHVRTPQGWYFATCNCEGFLNVFHRDAEGALQTVDNTIYETILIMIGEHPDAS